MTLCLHHTEEIAQNGNFQLFRDYTGGGDPLQAPNVITRLNTMADTYLECYQKCKDYNSESTISPQLSITYENAREGGCGEKGPVSKLSE
jgi:hypothetical protein